MHLIHLAHRAVSLVAMTTSLGCALAHGESSDDPATADHGAPPSTILVVPRACNDAPLDAWSTPTKLDVRGSTGSPAWEPYVLPDARTLLFAANDASGKRRLESATRPRIGDPFGAPAPLEIAGLEGQELDFPTAISAKEIVFTIKGELWVGTRATDAGPFAAHYYDDFTLNLGIAGVGNGWQTLSEDGRVMAFARGPLFKWRLHEARRTDTKPGAPWTAVAELSELNDPSGASITFCPVLSGNARSIWYSVVAGGPSSIWTARRESIAGSSPFGSKTRVPILEGALACPRAITADGCEMILQSNRDGTDAFYVSKRMR